MQGAGNPQLSKAVQARFGLPETFKTVSPFPFGGIDQQASRLAISDNSSWYLENLIKIGEGNLRAVPDLGQPLYTKHSGDTRQIINFFWFNIGLVNYCIVFFDDGSAIQLDTMGAATTIVPAGTRTFYSVNGPYPATVPWGSLYLLISNNNTQNDYWVWDGAILYSAGTIGPQVTLTSSGASYTATPSITVFGGLGSGVILSPTIKNGAVVSLKVLNPGTGYVPGDVVQVLFSFGGGDTSAQLQAFLQPTTVNQAIILNGGSGYTSAPTVTFSGGGPVSDATGIASISGGAVVGITITSGGSAYSSLPTITLTGGGGTGAQAQATLFAQPLAGVTVVNGGTNFSGIPTLTFKGGLGTGAVGVAVLSGPGPIASVTVTNGGSGYTSLPAVTIADSGGGTGSGATAIVTGASGGSITAITVTNAGTGYTAPIVSFSGGGGTGAAATAAVGAGSIASVNLTNQGSGYINAPAVIVESGLNDAAAATIELMPFGVSGSSIETYVSEVWLQNPYQQPGGQPVGGVRVSSAPGSVTDFATSDGGLEETNTDRFLRRKLTSLRQSNGFLYPFGDSSVNVISNVQVSGNPATKSLTNQNTDPQTGTLWRDSMQDFSRTILFANPFGVFGLFGGAVTKLSSNIDGLYNSAKFPTTENPSPVDTVTPSAAVANLYNRKIYLLLVNLKDPFDGTFRNKMLAWNEKDWCVISQTVDMQFIGTQEINSDLVAWGTDGTSIWPLMQSPSVGTLKVLTTKLYGAAQPYITKVARVVYVQAENFMTPNAAPLFSTTISTEYADFPLSGNPAVAFPPANLPPIAQRPPVQCPLLMQRTGDVPGQQLGLTIRSTAADFALYNLMLATEDDSAIFG